MATSFIPAPEQGFAGAAHLSAATGKAKQVYSGSRGAPGNRFAGPVNPMGGRSA
jgi:hypothetical protein